MPGIELMKDHPRKRPYEITMKVAYYRDHQQSTDQMPAACLPSFCKDHQLASSLAAFRLQPEHGAACALCGLLPESNNNHLNGAPTKAEASSKE